MGGNFLKVAVVAAAMSFAGGAAFAADSGMIDKFTPKNVGEALGSIGIAYTVESDPRGFPMIVVNTAKFPVKQFNIMFFSCDKVQAECDDIALWSWYDVGGNVSEKVIFAWNDPFQGRRWSTAYIDKDNDPALTMNINATGGIGERALQILVNTYVEDIFAFRDLLKEARVSFNTAPSSSKGLSEDVQGITLVDGDVLQMTELIKEFGGASFARMKETDKK